MPRLFHLTALFLVVLSATLVSAGQFVLPRGGTLDLSAPIKVAWNRPEKPDSDWVGLLNITAWLDWTSPAGDDGYRAYDIALGRSSDEPGDAIWDPREARTFLEANSTYAASIRFSSTVSRPEFLRLLAPVTAGHDARASTSRPVPTWGVLGSEGSN
jgi:hypothetical protein